MKHLFKFVKERKFILIFFLVLSLLSISLFFPTEKEKEVINIRSSYHFKDPKQYKIEEIEDKTFVESVSKNFSFYFPKSWIWETFYEGREDILIPIETKGLLLFPFQEKDDTCKIYLLVYEEEKELEYLKSVAEKEKSIKVDNYYGTKKETETEIYVKIPAQEEIFEIGAHFKKEEKESCARKYYELLDSISFLKKDEN